MKISFENVDKVNGQLTLVVDTEDYKEKVEKKLKEYRRKANVPGFRPGNVPMGMIKRQYGTAVKVDEINKLLGEELYKYVRENNISMLGEPLPSEKQVPQDLEGDGPFEFIFDIAIAPAFAITLDANDKIDYYDIAVDEEIIDQQVSAFASNNGHYEKVEDFDPEKRDMLKGDLRQLDADGNTLEGGITVSDAVMMPQYMKGEDQKALFEGQAAVDQQLFDNVFGEGAVNSEEEFRSKIAEGLKGQLTVESDYQFLTDLRAYAENKVGELTFPEELLKRIMKNNNKDKDEKYVDDNFDASIRELKWHLIKEQLVAANNIKVEEADMKIAAREMARAQFAQYGMNQVPDEYLDNYAADMLKKKEYTDTIVDRVVDRKLMLAIKNVVKLNVKEVTLAEFREMTKA